MEQHLTQLQHLASKEVESLLAALPGPLRARAKAVSVLFDMRPNQAQCQDGIAADTLGLFIGPEFAEGEATSSPLPPQIVLFLENIWDLAEANEETFREEVHITYLHELGHYLGLDEDQLFDRGLE
jgi:predicted Zn-dependent protease with MMP-like domain